MVQCGGAGHSIEIAKRLSSKGRLIGIDRDEEGNKLVIKSITGAIEEAEKIGFELAKNILKEYNSL